MVNGRAGRVTPGSCSTPLWGQRIIIRCLNMAGPGGLLRAPCPPPFGSAQKSRCLKLLLAILSNLFGSNPPGGSCKSVVLEFYSTAQFAVLIWLGREDSNLRMTGSKPVALPLGDGPTNSVFIVRSKD